MDVDATPQRVALGIEYNGHAFHGWQTQKDPEMPTLQACLERGLSQIADHPITSHCAGRTDTGVHAMCQVVHFDTTAIRPDKAWLQGTNTALPPDICVRWVKPVASDFHARFSAFKRRYRYIIYNHPVRSALYAGQATWQCLPLCTDTMHKEAQCLVGTHDFSGYRATACQSRSPVRDVDFVTVQRQGDLVILDIQANAFLMHMIRNIAGVLMAVGCGKQETGWARQVLEGRDRKQGGVTARPDGLYFMGALYPEHYGLPGFAAAPAFAFTE